MKWQAEIIARPKRFRCLIRATVIFEADNAADAEELAAEYCNRLGMYDSADIDSLFELVS